MRCAEPGDAAAIAKLLGDLGYPAPAEEIPGRLKRLTEGGGVALVAASEGKVVGVAAVHLFPALHASTPVAHLTALVVGESHRGRGIGKRLAAAAVAHAEAAGCARIVVGTAEHRAEAHAFYESIGWEHTGRRFALLLSRPS